MNGGVRPVCWESRMESRRECTCLQGTQTSPSGAFRGGGGDAGPVLPDLSRKAENPDCLTKSPGF